MSKRILLGVLLAVAASAITAGAVVVVGHGGGQGGEVKIPPVKALKPGELKPPAGTPVAGLALPMDYGRFRILGDGVTDYLPPSRRLPASRGRTGTSGHRRRLMISARTACSSSHPISPPVGS
jgi:hypothetical protein